MPLGYSNIHRPQPVSRSVSFDVVEPYIETSSLSLGKSISSGNLVQTAATFPGRNRRLISRSHSNDEAYLCSRLAADILSDTTNIDDISVDRSATPFVSATPNISSSLRAFSSATQECRDGATTDDMDDDETSAADAAQENNEDDIFRSAAAAAASPSGNKLSFIHRLEPTIGEASDEEDEQGEEDVGDEEYAYTFNIRRGDEPSQRDDSPSRQGSSPSLLCLKRANPIYDGPAGDSDSETGSATKSDNDQSWPTSEFESPAKRSRKHMMIEEDHHVDETDVEAAAATTTILATPALYYRPEDICSSSVTLGEVSAPTPTNDDQLMATQSLEADEVDGYNISAIFASAE